MAYEINFKNDSWRNLYKKAKNVKDAKEQLQINQAIFDYIQALQLQVTEQKNEIRELQEVLRKEKLK